MLVEDCLSISQKSFGKDWDRIKRGEKFQGEVQITPRLSLSYWTENKDGEMQIVIAIGADLQTITLSTSELTYGTHFFFVCQCEKSCHKLYLPPGSKEWKCFKCSPTLKYGSSQTSSNPYIGAILYKARWMNKAMQLEEMVGRRRIYNNNFTRRYLSFLSASKKAGIDNLVDNASILFSIMRERTQSI